MNLCVARHRHRSIGTGTIIKYVREHGLTYHIYLLALSAEGD